MDVKFLIPTVGCEADAASFEEDRREYEAGSYTACVHEGAVLFAPRRLPDAEGVVALEASLLLATRRRVRVRARLQRYSAAAAWTLRKLDVLEEEWVAPFCGGRELPMACGAGEQFSDSTPLDENCTKGVTSAAPLTGLSWFDGAVATAEASRLPLGLVVRCAGNDAGAVLEVARWQEDAGTVWSQVGYEAGGLAVFRIVGQQVQDR